MEPEPLLIDRPLDLVDLLFGPEQQITGIWRQFHESAAPIYYVEDIDEYGREDEEYALEDQGDVCA